MRRTIEFISVAWNHSELARHLTLWQVETSTQRRTRRDVTHFTNTVDSDFFERDEICLQKSIAVFVDCLDCCCCRCWLDTFLAMVG